MHVTAQLATCKKKKLMDKLYPSSQGSKEGYMTLMHVNSSYMSHFFACYLTIWGFIFNDGIIDTIIDYYNQVDVNLLTT